MPMKLPALFLLLTFCAGTQAQTEEALRCRALTDDRERLACFDRWAAGLSRSPAPPPLGKAAPAAAPAAPVAVAAAVAPAAAPAAPSTFGLPVKKAADDALDDRIEGLFEGWAPKGLIRLQSGQVWRVADDSSAFLNLKSPKVRVQRNLMGGYVMEFEGSNRTVRVKRVQ